jgi:hypothetical protein
LVGGVTVTVMTRFVVVAGAAIVPAGKAVNA